jgi:hypothetical protein
MGVYGGDQPLVKGWKTKERKKKKSLLEASAFISSHTPYENANKKVKLN